MRPVFAILLCLFLMPLRLFANEIDDLRTAEDVQRFLVQKINPDWTAASVIEGTPEDTLTYGKGRFFKLDLNGDGLTDLLVNGNLFFAIIDKGAGQYERHDIDRGSRSDKHTLRNIIRLNNTPMLVIRKHDIFTPERDSAAKPDTLVFRYGGFMEYNSKVKPVKIKAISFTGEACFGSCPVFELNIKADRSATFNAIEYNDRQGKFQGRIDTAAYNQLLETLSYIKAASLKSSYRVPWTDDRTVTLVVRFANGKTKKITDYGAIGTYGLAHLYRQLQALRSTQQWQ
jgi:hypothetical protein